jgi:hypothetical protein
MDLGFSENERLSEQNHLNFKAFNPQYYIVNHLKSLFHIENKKSSLIQPSTARNSCKELNFLLA